MTTLIARCPAHGLHGERTECYVCDGPVEQIPMVALADVVKLLHRQQTEVDRGDQCPDPSWLAAHLVQRLGES